jgi:hypothetical protein
LQAYGGFNVLEFNGFPTPACGGAGTIYGKNGTTSFVSVSGVYECTNVASPLAFLPNNTKLLTAINALVLTQYQAFGLLSCPPNCLVVRIERGLIFANMSTPPTITTGRNNSTCCSLAVSELVIDSATIYFQFDSLQPVFFNSTGRTLYFTDVELQVSNNAQKVFCYFNFTENVGIQSFSIDSKNQSLLSVYAGENVALGEDFLVSKILVQAKNIGIISASLSPMNGSECIIGINASEVTCSADAINQYQNVVMLLAAESITVSTYSIIENSLIFLCANNITVLEGAIISASDGCPSGVGSGAGISVENDCSGTAAGGAGYGGSGGEGENNPNSGGISYYVKSLVSTGSGGGCCNSGATPCSSWFGLNGGGIVSFFARNSIVFNGTVSAEGPIYQDKYCSFGGASGGSVAFSAVSFSGSGNINATGGYQQCAGNSKFYFLTFLLCLIGNYLGGGGGGGGYVQFISRQLNNALLTTNIKVNINGGTPYCPQFPQCPTSGENGTIDGLPFCSPGFGTNPAEGLYCRSCDAGFYSTGGTGSCRRCSNKPANSFYSESNWVTSNCPYVCDSGYSTDSCLPPITSPDLKLWNDWFSLVALHLFVEIIATLFSIPFMFYLLTFCPGWEKMRNLFCGRARGEFTRNLTDEQFDNFRLHRRIRAGIPEYQIYGTTILRVVAVADFMRYSLYEHHLFGISFVEKDHPYSREFRGMVYFMVNSVAFVIYIISYQQPSPLFRNGLEYLFVLVLITLKIFIYWFIYTLEARIYFRDSMKQKMMLRIYNGLVLILVLFLYYFSAVWMAASIQNSSIVYPDWHSTQVAIQSYLLNVVLLGAIEETFLHAQLFIHLPDGLPRYIKWLSCGFSRIGAWDMENDIALCSRAWSFYDQRSLVLPSTSKPRASEIVMVENPLKPADN